MRHDQTREEADDHAADLKGKKIAILATDGVEEIELTGPRKALEDAGATVELLAPRGGTIQAMDHVEKSRVLAVDRAVTEAAPEDYDGLVLPGGVRNADALRVDRPSVRFTTSIIERNVPVGVICHGAWILIETGTLNGRTMTSYPSLRTDLENAGVRWVDEEVHTENGIVSSRRPRTCRRSTPRSSRSSPMACTSASQPEPGPGRRGRPRRRRHWRPAAREDRHE